ncbi:phenylalanine--tRNA ligase subunit beta [Nanohaloarchaea archaeon]|nr:phenylalanine--tRNA ligase subunit beta [Candidatus Nanohaloarchaea archaeon]
MATIEIDKREFTDLVGEDFSNQKLMDEASFLGVHWHEIDGNVCEVENYPNRPDCLSVEGIARAYRGFFDLERGREQYSLSEGDIEVFVDDSVEEVRPVLGGCVVRDLDLSEKVINGLIQLQEKLHHTMGRQRDKIAIGLHDLSSLEPPFTYKAVGGNEVEFQPLNYNESMSLGQILEEHEKGQDYGWILEDEEAFPVIVDDRDQVLSFPPIINNKLTEVDSDTTDLFVDVTGKDRQAVMSALNIVVTALAERGGRVESVTVDGERLPDLSPSRMELDPDYFRDVSGVDLEVSEIVDRLEMMKHGAEKADGCIEVEVPCYRSDVMHQYDLIEDVLIAHRYRNVVPEVPELDQVGRQPDIQDTAQVIRDILTGSGATESMTYVHTSEGDLTEGMNLDKDDYVRLENPLSEDFGSLRNMVVPSLLDVLSQNRQHSYPQSFFEVGDSVELDDSSTGASNVKKVAFVKSGQSVDFTDARRTLKTLERDLGINLEIKSSERPFFKNSRSADIYVEEQKIGFVGEFSDKVCDSWQLDNSVSGFEINLEEVQSALEK